MPLIFTIVNLLTRQLTGSIRVNDSFLALGQYVVLSIYLSIAVRRFYGFMGWRRVGFVLISLLWHTAVVYHLYKWLLFVATFAQIHA